MKTIEPSKAKKGLFSVIIATLNSEKHLKQCIDSFACQTYYNKELIIIDGVSTDGTLGIIDDNKHIISTAISEPDSGIYEALNKGIKLSQGEWIIFLGADDYFYNNNVLSDVSDIISVNWNGQYLAYGKVFTLNIDQKIISIKGIPNSPEQKNNPEEFMHHQGVFHHRTLFEKIGLYDESFKVCGDVELLGRGSPYKDIISLDIMISYFRMGGISYKKKNYMTAYNEIIRCNSKISPISITYRYRLLSFRFKITIYAIISKMCGADFANKAMYIINVLRGRIKFKVTYYKNASKIY